jgi:hypothetical protein
MRNHHMPNQHACLPLYDPSDDDVGQVLLRCSDLTAFICQVLYPGSDPAGHYADAKLRHAGPPATLLWWLSSLRMTLESLYCTLVTSPPDALATALQAYLAQHPEQASDLRQVLVDALARDFTGWQQVRGVMVSAPPPNEDAE